MELSFTFGTAHAGQWVSKVGGELTHPDGWVTIEGPDAVTIIAYAARNWPSGNPRTPKCAFWYEGPEPSSPELYTRGMIEKIVLPSENW